MTVDWFKHWAKISPGNIALKDSETNVEYSYSQSFRAITSLAYQLRKQFKIEKGDRVAALATNEVEYVFLFFALQRLGAILVPINFRLTSREIQHIVRDSEPKLIVHQTQFENVVNEVKGAAATWTFEGSRGMKKLVEIACATAGDIADLQYANLDSEFEKPCMILYTSGTTGAPKGAMITPKMMHWNSISTGLRLNLTQNDVHVAFLPFFHTGGWNVLVTPFLHRGAKTLLLKKFEPETLISLCEKERATILFGVPTTMDMIAQAPSFAKADLSSIRYAVVGGEPMPLSLIQTWQKKGIPVRQGYGLTEFGPNVFSLNEEDSIRKIGSIGFANMYIETRVVDETGNDVEENQIGELILRGPAQTSGYWNNPEATSNTIRDGWLHTGDLVRADEDGYFFVVGRKKDMYISGAENVYPVEVEQFLRSHPKIKEVAVIGVPDEKWGEVGKAFVVPKDGVELLAEEVLSFCSGQLAKYKVPKHIEFLRDLPKGDSGKILKRELTRT